MFVSILPFKIDKRYLITIILFLIYIAMFIITLLLNNLSFSSLFREIILFISIISIIILLNNKEYIYDFFKGIWVSLTLTALVYFTEINLSMIFNLFYRFGTETNPNVVGGTAAMYFLLNLYFFYSTKNKYNKLFLLSFLLIALVIVIATKSRTAIMMLVFAFFILNILLKKRKTIIISLTLIISLFLANFNKFDNVLRFSKKTNIAKNKTLSNLTGRADIWTKGLKMIDENFYFGVGPENARVKTDAGYKHLHNAYIQLMANVGIFGSIPILILILIALTKLIFYKEDIFMQAIILTGFVGSITEPRLLNYGLPSNLLFLISFIYMSSSWPFSKKGSSLISQRSS